MTQRELHQSRISIGTLAMHMGQLRRAWLTIDAAAAGSATLCHYQSMATLPILMRMRCSLITKASAFTGTPRPCQKIEMFRWWQPTASSRSRGGKCNS